MENHLNTKQTKIVTVNGVNYLIDDSPINNAKYVGEFGDNEEILIKKVSKAMATTNDGRWKQILAIEYPNTLEGVPQYKLPDEDEKIYLAKLQANYSLAHGDLEAGVHFGNGYKANKAKWTDEDINDAVKQGALIAMGCVEEPKNAGEFNFNQKKAIKECKYYLQSLNKPRKIESIEIDTGEPEMLGEVFNGINSNKMWSDKQVFKLTPEGFLDIKVNYKQ